MSGFAFLSAASAAAAADLPSPTAFTVKGGVSVESNASPQNAGFSAGVDYIFHPSSTLQPFNTSFYGDLLGKSGGVGVAIRNGGPVYIGAGAGFYSVSVTPSHGCGALPGDNCANPTYTSSGLGGKVFGGFGIAPFTSLEIGYHFLPAANGIQTNTVTAQLAVRF